jgi:hypothetical protein
MKQFFEHANITALLLPIRVGANGDETTSWKHHPTRCPRCDEPPLSVREVTGGSERGQIVEPRAIISHVAVRSYGAPLAEVARTLHIVGVNNRWPN